MSQPIKLIIALCFLSIAAIFAWEIHQSDLEPSKKSLGWLFVIVPLGLGTLFLAFGLRPQHIPNNLRGYITQRVHWGNIAFGLSIILFSLGVLGLQLVIPFPDKLVAFCLLGIPAGLLIAMSIYTDICKSCRKNLVVRLKEEQVYRYCPICQNYLIGGSKNKPLVWTKQEAKERILRLS